MKKMLIILSVMILIIANVGLSQDIINETGKHGKFIVRDAEENDIQSLLSTFNLLISGFNIFRYYAKF